MNTYDEWQVDLPNRSATHVSGLRITVDGSPANPSAVYPGPFPSELSALKQVQLLREGMLAIAASYKAQRSELQEGGGAAASGYSKPYRKTSANGEDVELQGAGYSNRQGQADKKTQARHVTSGYLRSGRQAQHRAQQRAQHQGNGAQGNGQYQGSGGQGSGHYQGSGGQGSGHYQGSGGQGNGQQGEGYKGSGHQHAKNGFRKKEGFHKRDGGYQSGNGAPNKQYRDGFSSDQKRRSQNKFHHGGGQSRYSDKPYSANGNTYQKPNAPYFPSDSNSPSSYANSYNRRVLAADQLKSQNRRGNGAISDDHLKERSAQRVTSGNVAVKTLNKVAIKRAPSRIASSDKDKKPLLSLKDKP